MKFDPMTNLIDAYKLDHRRMYPPGTEYVYSNFTPRTSRIEGVDRVVFFGLQSFLLKLQHWFGEWFSLGEDYACLIYAQRVEEILGPNSVGTDHVRALHRLGYLPLEFKALPEGTEVPLRVPMFTVENTLPEFFWLTNYFETILSCEIWQACTSATLALRMRRLLDQYADMTSDMPAFVDWQAHDFSFRGMSSMESAGMSGAAHLLSFSGSDTLCAIDWIDAYYPRERPSECLLGSVAATEHSVMCAGGYEGEISTFERLLDLYPSGILSVVSDTWNLWEVLTVYLPELKDKIMKREGKLVIRPDSGDPVAILCGTKWGHCGPGATPEEKGVIELLWDTFGGTVNDKGYKQLDPHIGAIYGDSITFDRAQAILAALEVKGFASTNVVFGVGSYTYQYNTRDTFGFAMKATWAQICGEGVNLYKDPVTDNGVKKSATGRLAVIAQEDDGLLLVEKAGEEVMAASLLETIWKDGQMLLPQTWEDVLEVIGARSAYNVE